MPRVLKINASTKSLVERRWALSGWRRSDLVVVIEHGNGEAVVPGTGGRASRCPTFSGRDTEWSEWSFFFESVAAMANLEPVMESAFIGSAENRLQSSNLVRNSCTIS